MRASPGTLPAQSLPLNLEPGPASYDLLGRSCPLLCVTWLSSVWPQATFTDTCSISLHLSLLP